MALDAFDGLQMNSGYASDTTIGRMELEGVAEGLEYVHTVYGEQDVIVFCDSQYVVLGCKNKKRKRRKNRDLWNRVEEAVGNHNHVEFEHVYGHKGHKFNEMADELAGQARRDGIFPNGT